MTTKKTPTNTDPVEVSPEGQAAPEQADVTREADGDAVAVLAEKREAKEQASRAAERAKQTATAQLPTAQPRTVTARGQMTSAISELVDNATRRIRSHHRTPEPASPADFLLAVSSRRSRIPLIAGAAGLLIIAVVVRRMRR